MARRAAYLAQGAEPLGVDRGLVHENLFRAVVGGDEPETLLGVEPLHLRASPARGSVRKRAIEASKKNPSVVVKNIRGRERSAARRRGSARVASEEGVRHAVRRRRHTLPVSFVIVFRGGNCDWRERRAYAMAVGGCFRRDKSFVFCWCHSCERRESLAFERGDAVTSLSRRYFRGTSSVNRFFSKAFEPAVAFLILPNSSP